MTNPPKVILVTFIIIITIITLLLYGTQIILTSNSETIARVFHNTMQPTPDEQNYNGRRESEQC